VPGAGAPQHDFALVSSRRESQTLKADFTIPLVTPRGGMLPIGRIAMVDPYPDLSLRAAIELLQQRFGIEHVRVEPVNGDVFIDIRVPNQPGYFRSIGLADKQAKYLAKHSSITEKMLLNEKLLPANWPHG
jgi:hypothetical protein